MKEKSREKNFSSKKHKKSKKKYKRKYDNSSDSDSGGDNMKWVEAAPYDKDKKVKKKKKKYKKYESSSSNSDSDKWIEASHSSSYLEKEKKHKKEKHKNSSSSDSESSGNKYSKTESSPHRIIAEQRESWMNEETFVPTLSKHEIYSSSRQKRINSARQQQEKEEKVKNQRELNPHWRNDGTGLPEKDSNVGSLSLPSTSVGDGGYSWLKKAYFRIQEQSQQQGRSMEEVAVERWGSLSKLTSLIEEAENRMKSYPDFNRSSVYSVNNKYEKDSKTSKSHFKKPNNDKEYGRSFDSPFQFKKPIFESKTNKMVNQFKSTSKSTYMKHEELDEKIENQDLSHCKYAHKEKMSRFVTENPRNENRQSSANETRIPAWKKSKVSVEKPKESESMDTIKPGTCVAENMPVIYSDDDLNKLAAKQLRAELMGISLAKELKYQLEVAIRMVKEKGFAKPPAKKTEEVILTKIGSQGQVRPIQSTQEKIEDFKHKKSNKYFDDGSRHSLKQMFEREKLTTADDHMEMFVEASAHSNEMTELDYESGHISKKLSKKISATCEEERNIGKAIQQHQKLTASTERCNYCLDSPNMKKYLIVDIGEQVYLCLPKFQSLTEGHCLIVPKAHVTSFLSLDENDWKEVNDMKNQLRSMFRSDNKSVIFLECSMKFRYFPHAIIECIPVPIEDGDMAPFYFKKAIQESEYEWAHNKKLIDLKNKGLRYSVPRNLPYFHVEFDPNVHAGYAHVIEDENNFPRNFGKEVVGGMIDINYNHLYKNKREDPCKKSKEVVEFQKIWKKFKNME